ncbi:MAG: hypothetical protein HND50_01385 [Calditrichaeota bacterium]|nr:hypothetical protein [Calditrichota bacterium]
MHRFIYKFAVFVSVITLVTALMNGVSIMTTFVRTGLVFLGTLILFVVFLNVMRWAIVTTTIIEKHDEETENEQQMREELLKQMKKGLHKNKTDDQLIGKED